MVQKVPNVDTVRLSYEDYSRSRWGESATGVVSTVRWRGQEDWPLISFEVCFPDGKMEVVHGKKQIWEEWRSLKSKSWPVFFLTVIRESDILSKLGSIVTGTNWLDTPIN